MATVKGSTALIVGAGSGLSAALARRLSAAGARVALAARNAAKLSDITAEISGAAFACDASRTQDVAQLFAAVTQLMGAPDIVVYNAGARLRGPIAQLDPAEVERSIAITAFGGFLVGRQAAASMLERASGTILFSGASASIKGYAQSAPFAMGKFALRGLAQSMARELGPKGIHVAHIVIDGGIRSASRPVPDNAPDSLLAPEAIAQTYLDLIEQPRSAWTHELEVRPWVETF
jgi:NAD(P)-dependent dehydrogenase (short-subunit alcohol dehydrogenase family)